MRFIIHEMSYEKPVTAGRWLYQLDNQPTGAHEEWRLTEAVDGYHFLRVDLDARFAPSGRSTLYHLTLDENGDAVQLKYRFWADNLEMIGNVLLEEDAVIFTRETVGDRQEAVLGVPKGYAFWFPATAGLGLLVGLGNRESHTAVTLQTAVDDRESLMNPMITAVSINEEGTEPIVVMGEDKTVRRLAIRWEDQQRTLWIDEQGWPLQMRRNDGLTAVLSRQIVYGQISKPGVAKGVQAR